jgi:hypothetical protein
MKPFNWTDCEHPCFVDYTGDPDDDCPDDCDWFDGESVPATCHFKEVLGGSWDTCGEGRLSHWQDWLPKEANSAG